MKQERWSKARRRRRWQVEEHGGQRGGEKRGGEEEEDEEERRRSEGGVKEQTRIGGGAPFKSRKFGQSLFVSSFIKRRRRQMSAVNET